jgi:hypothetical protein
VEVGIKKLNYANGNIRSGKVEIRKIGYGKIDKIAENAYKCIYLCIKDIEN